MISFQTVVFPIFVILILLSLRKSSGKDPLSFTNSSLLRGIFAAFIIIFHVSKESDLIYEAFHYSSLTAVGAFFFLSGYGAMKRYMADDGYYKGYLYKRFVNLILPYMIMTLVYWVYHLWIGHDYSLFEVIHTAIIGAPLVTYSWFIVSIIYHYLVFAVVLFFARNNRKLLVCVFCLLGLFSILCMLYHYSNTYLIRVMFVLGILYAYREGDLLPLLKKNNIWLMILSFALSMAIHFSGLQQKALYELIEQALFVVAMICSMTICRIDNSFITLLGKLSLEIYMCQGLAKMIIRRFYGGPLFIQDLFIYLLCFMLSYGFHRLFAYLRKLLLS